MSKYIILFIFGLAFTAFSNDYRTFTDKEGRAIKAKILKVDVQQKTVTLERENKKKATVPINIFSKTDQEYLYTWSPTSIPTSNAIEKVADDSAFSETNAVCITDIKYIASFAKRFEVDDVFWIPSPFPRKDFNQALKKYVYNREAKSESEWERKLLHKIAQQADKYFIEYSGVMRNGRKLILCQTTGCPSPRIVEKRNSYSIILDGGTSICVILYDPESNEILYCSWNGFA